MSLASKGLLRALSSGMALRLVGAVINVAIVPIAIRNLGHEQFAAFATLLGFASWLSLGSFGMGNVTAMAVAGGNGMVGEQREILWKSVMIVLASLLVVMSLAAWPFMRLVAHLKETLADSAHTDLQISSIYCLCAFAICAVATPFEGRYSGMLRTDYCNWVRLVGQILAFVVLTLSALYRPTLPAITFAMTIGPLSAAIWFLTKGILEVPPPRLVDIEWRDFLPQFRQGFGFFASAMAVLFLGGASLPLFAFCFGTDQLATAGVMTRIVQVYFSILAILLFPLSAALKHALSRGDVLWVRRVLPQSFFLMTGSALAAGFVLIMWGGSLISLWAGTHLPAASEWMLPLAVLLLAVSWCYLWVYSAFAVKGSLIVAKLAIAEVGLIAGCYWLLSDRIVPAYSMYISAVIITLGSGVWLPFAVLRALRLRDRSICKAGSMTQQMPEDANA